MSGISGAETPTHRQIHRRTAVLFGVVFVDLLGLGILLPLVPFYGVRLGLSAETLTLVISLHALFQFLGAPLLGRLSDQYGRRPVLLFSMAGHALAYLLLAFADTVWLLALSRILSGFTSGNLAAAYAYGADISTPAERTTTLARISAAFALGLTFGPLAGAALAGPGDPAAANLQAPAFAACALSLLSFLSILLFLPESPRRPERAAAATGAMAPVSAADAAAPPATAPPAAAVPPHRLPFVRVALALSLLVIVFSAMRETLFALWMHEKHGFDLKVTGAVIALHGLVAAAVQLFGTGRLSARFGEQHLLTFGILAYGASWLGLGLSTGLAAVLVAMTLSALATALFATSLQSLLTQSVTAAVRGGVLGALQSSSALARFLGAAVSGTLYGQLSPDAPFLLGALAMIPALFVGRLLQRSLAAQRVAGGVTS
jgi:DHA1 family tetracycline resistance protein-like MFS transporter